MKNIRFLVFILTVGTLVLSACGGAATPNLGAATPPTASGKVEAMPVAFIGIVDSMAGDQWVISGTTVTVDPAVVRDGPFNVGDQVKVEGIVNPDGSFTVSRVEVPAPQDISTLPPFGDDNSNDANANDNSNVNDGNINDDNSNDVNLNDDHGNDANLNDDHGNDANLNDDNSNTGSPSNTNTNDDHGGSGKGGGNDNGGSGKGSGGGGNDNGGNSNDD